MLLKKQCRLFGDGSLFGDCVFGWLSSYLLAVRLWAYCLRVSRGCYVVAGMDENDLKIFNWNVLVGLNSGARRETVKLMIQQAKPLSICLQETKLIE